MRRVALALVVLLAPGLARAYRPFVSTDAAVADPGEIEVEFGYIGFIRDGDRTAIVAPSVVANIGLVRDLELVGEFKVVSDVSPDEHQGHSPFEDSAVSLKWVVRAGVLQEHGTAPSLAVELSLLLPTLRGQDTPGGEVVGIASGRALGFTFHLNGGTIIEPG